MIFTDGLAYAYNNEKQISFLNLSATQGEHVLILGESGSGKTTLLHLLGGILRSTSGKIHVNDTDLSTLSEAELDHFRGRHFGFVFQRNHLVGALTVQENMLLAPFLAGIRQDMNRVKEVAEHLDLSPILHRNVRSLSQGQAQRVAIARAVLNRPTLILADEPTSALDDRNCGRVMALLADVSKENNTTLVVATHDQLLTGFSKKYVLS